MIGKKSGNRMLSISTFRNETDGYTSIASALALLVSLSLIFACLNVQWIFGRTSKIQRVADASALAGSQVVSKYASIVQIVDASTLSLGLTGVLCFAAGIVSALIPGAQVFSTTMLDTGSKVFDAQRTFVNTANKGLDTLEQTLPLLIFANGAGIGLKNGDSETTYSVLTIPVPLTGESNFDNYKADVEDEDLKSKTIDLQDKTQALNDLENEVKNIKYRAWILDCGGEPRSLFERTQQLATPTAQENIKYDSVDNWNFGASISRARVYYRKRLQQENPQSYQGDLRGDSALRKHFYEYALKEVNKAYYRESDDGTIDMYMPNLANNENKIRASSLFTEKIWPVVQKDGKEYVYPDISMAQGSSGLVTYVSLADIDSGAYESSSDYPLSAKKLGQVANASTNIDNGFEYYWRHIRQEAERYVPKYKKLKEKKDQLKQESENRRKELMNMLRESKSSSIDIKPAGYKGVISIAYRGETVDTPDAITKTFLTTKQIPKGAAISASALAPEKSTSDTNVLSVFFDGLQRKVGLLGGVLDGIATIWSQLLLGYEKMVDTLVSAAFSTLDFIDGIIGGSIASWIKGKIIDGLKASGFDPVDLSLYKPVLVPSQSVLDNGGYTSASSFIDLIKDFPTQSDPKDQMTYVGLWWDEKIEKLGKITLATLNIPGTDLSIDLDIDIRQILEAI